MKSHVTNLFLAWEERSLTSGEMERIDSHLKDCPACQVYFTKMGAALRDAGKASEAVLQPDPFLPTRIRAMAKEKRPGWAPGSVLTPVLRFSAASAGLIAAIVLGVFLGKGLVPINTVNSADRPDVITSYYGALSGQDAATFAYADSTVTTGKEQR